ncbi:MAG: dockerin type I repeat-containing protein [Planctomycetes bacterium]|nr:dockerin type I repeat-containing protein [Planctomycetota bacterium]
MPRRHCRSTFAALAFVASVLVPSFAVVAGAAAQCESVGFSGSAGSPAQQGFAAFGAPVIQPLPNGTIRWIVQPGTLGLFAPPSPPWPGGTGPRQEVSCTMRVVSSPPTLSPTGVHDSGFSIYRGVCIQGGNVVAGVTNDGIFISISTPTGVETEYEFAPFNTTAGPAVYHFEATDHGQTLTAVSATQTATAHRPRGRYSDAPSTWRVGGGGVAAAEVIVSNWTVAQGLPPVIVSSTGAAATCPGGSVTAQVNASAGEDGQFQWQLEDASSPTGWRDLNDGPLFIAGALWGNVNGSRNRQCLFMHGLGQRADALRTRCVVTTGCGAASSPPSALRLLPDFNASGAVNTADLAILLGSFGRPVAAFCCGDIDGDGLVNTADLAKFLGDFGQACP